MERDRRSRGWTYSHLAADAGVSCSTVMRFLRGDFQSPKTAKKLALAIGYPLERYVLGSDKQAVA